MIFRLSFDSNKNDANWRKHGLSLSDAGLVYLSAEKVTFDTVRGTEQRKIDIAPVALANAVLVLVYVERSGKVRAISLRRASRRERERYANAKED